MGAKMSNVSKPYKKLYRFFFILNSSQHIIWHDTRVFGRSCVFTIMSIWVGHQEPKLGLKDNFITLFLKFFFKFMEHLWAYDENYYYYYSCCPGTLTHPGSWCWTFCPHPISSPYHTWFLEITKQAYIFIPSFGIIPLS